MFERELLANFAMIGNSALWKKSSFRNITPLELLTLLEVPWEELWDALRDLGLIGILGKRIWDSLFRGDYSPERYFRLIRKQIDGDLNNWFSWFDLLREGFETQAIQKLNLERQERKRFFRKRELLANRWLKGRLDLYSRSKTDIGIPFERLIDQRVAKSFLFDEVQRVSGRRAIGSMANQARPASLLNTGWRRISHYLDSIEEWYTFPAQAMLERVFLRTQDYIPEYLLFRIWKRDWLQGGNYVSASAVLAITARLASMEQSSPDQRSYFLGFLRRLQESAGNDILLARYADICARVITEERLFGLGMRWPLPADTLRAERIYIDTGAGPEHLEVSTTVKDEANRALELSRVTDPSEFTELNAALLLRRLAQKNHKRSIGEVISVIVADAEMKKACLDKNRFLDNRERQALRAITRDYWKKRDYKAAEA